MVFVLTNGAKQGLYGLDAGWYLPARYDSVSLRALSYGMVLVKNRQDETYDRYLFDSGEIVDTDITRIDGGLFPHAYLDYVQRQDGRFYQLQKDTLLPIAAEAIRGAIPAADLVLADPAAAPSPVLNGASASDLGVDEIVSSYDFGDPGLFDRYGYSALYVVRRGRGVGVMNEKGTILLPLIYDRVSLEYYGDYARLEKNGRVGYKLFFSPYPVIEPKYDDILDLKMLSSNDQRTFTCFLVEQNGQRAYVGENGVEYFDLE